jgi:putative addiction module component (TIGR02574 family)
MEERLTAAQLRKLSVAERILLVQDIWDSIAEEQESLKVTDAQRKELDRRIDAYNASPGEGASWEEIKNRLKASKW